MDRPRLLIASVLAIAFVALLGLLANDKRDLAGESVLEEAQNPNSSAMMAKLQAEAANLKKVLARQQAEKQAIAQLQSVSNAKHDQQTGDQTPLARVDSTPVVIRDSKSIEPLEQHPQDTLNVQPSGTPPVDKHSEGATVVDSASPSVDDIVPESSVEQPAENRAAGAGGSDTGNQKGKSSGEQKKPTGVGGDLHQKSTGDSDADEAAPGISSTSNADKAPPADSSTPDVDKPAPVPAENTDVRAKSVPATLPADSSSKTIEPQTLPAKSEQTTKDSDDDDDEIETIWKFYDEHQMIFNVVWISLGVLAAAVVVGLLHHGCTTGNNVKNRRVYH